MVETGQVGVGESRREPEGAGRSRKKPGGAGRSRKEPEGSSYAELIISWS